MRTTGDNDSAHPTDAALQNAVNAIQTIFVYRTNNSGRSANTGSGSLLR